MDESPRESASPRPSEASAKAINETIAASLRRSLWPGSSP
ncbi:hypothetical protein AKJ08_1533 [Vulgatibacter incomptus]|uniref:Uncharacterized protein n=1 Tax=Vulgatibacter incomptus TaxID=1391653 RepID=A0A0K1PCJ5_9BACT|nr:hypothetical protein AKJ08_1533 [Vulgatibacter incomptus]